MHIKVYSDTFSKQENHKLLHFQQTPTNFSHRTTKESAFFCFEKENGDRNFPPSGTVEVLYSNHITCWHDSTIRAVSMLVGKTLDHTNLNGDSIQCPPTKKKLTFDPKARNVFNLQMAQSSIFHGTFNVSI